MEVDEPVAEPVAEFVAEPVAETVAELGAEHVTEPVADPVVEHVAEPVADPVVESDQVKKGTFSRRSIFAPGQILSFVFKDP